MSEAEQAIIVHDAIQPSRGGMPGETAFLTAWQDLMSSMDEDEEGGPLHDVHSMRWSPAPECDQADATMAATLIQWLGTNAGACMVAQARKLQAAGLTGREAFVAAPGSGRRPARNSSPPASASWRPTTPTSGPGIGRPTAPGSDRRTG
jgi:hypothetical protein